VTDITLENSEEQLHWLLTRRAQRTDSSREIFRLRRAHREARRIFLRPRASHASLTGQSEREKAVEPGVVCLRWPSLGAHVEGGRGARAAGAVDCAAWRGESGPVAVPQRLGRPESRLRGC